MHSHNTQAHTRLPCNHTHTPRCTTHTHPPRCARAQGAHHSARCELGCAPGCPTRGAPQSSKTRAKYHFPSRLLHLDSPLGVLCVRDVPVKLSTRTVAGRPHGQCFCPCSFTSPLIHANLAFLGQGWQEGLACPAWCLFVAHGVKRAPVGQELALCCATDRQAFTAPLTGCKPFKHMCRRRLTLCLR